MNSLPSHSRILPVALILTFALSLPTPAFAATSADVNTSIKKAVAWLYSQQHDGNWETVSTPLTGPGQHDKVEGGQWGGLTSIAVFALLSAGENPHDPRIQSAVTFLEHATLRGTYAVSMRAQVWPLMPPAPDIEQAANRDAKLLLGGAKRTGDGRALWFYYLDEPDTSDSDNSASQLAVLGVWACSEAGAEIPTSFWKTEDTIWRAHQASDGSWNYCGHGPDFWQKPYLSMTCAGLATLFITHNELPESYRLDCGGNAQDANIDHGMKWVADNFPSDLNNLPDSACIRYGGHPQYLMFMLQRLGVASGLRYFGTHDWFQDGANFWLKSQHDDGSWDQGNEHASSTAFGILFLARGQSPVVFNKLNYVGDPPAKTAYWNQRPRDIANATKWMGHELETRFNWEIVDLASSPSDWADAPLLYIGGSEELKLSDTAKEKIKRFIDDGGIVIGNADCGKKAFANSFVALGKSLYPNYTFRQLPEDSPIFTKEQFPSKKWTKKLSVQALSNGVREMMFLFPERDISKNWELNSLVHSPESFQFASDLLLYASPVEKLRFKGDTLIIDPDTNIHADRTIKVARLQYGGNWNPEPVAWPRLANIMHNTQHIDLDVQTVASGTGKLDPSFKLAHLTGTGSITLSDGCRNELKTFVDGGGTLFIDSAGGNSAFATSIESELSKIFPDTSLTAIKSNDSVLAQPFDLHKVTYRPFARATLGNLSAPMLKGLTINNRLAVVESRIDITTGLLGTDTDGIIGYDPRFATELATNICCSTTAK